MIRQYFKVGDVTQYDPRRIPVRGSIEERNILKLDKLRIKWGAPLGVISWWRPDGKKYGRDFVDMKFYLEKLKICQNLL